MVIEPIGKCRWVLLPGTLCTADMFTGFLDHLGVPRSKRAAIELRHPRVEDYLQGLGQICTGSTIVCGFSLGAIVAAHLADRIDAARFVLFGLNPQADDPTKRDGRLALARDVQRLGGTAALDPRLAPLNGPHPERGRARILEMADASEAWIEAQTRLALDRPGALDALRRTDCPVGLLTGTEDTQAPLGLAAQAAAAAPQGRLVPLPGLGHYSLIEDPATCADAVAQLWEAA
jgi:pimeloyl-ACP methyl ester carboxylesterase